MTCKQELCEFWSGDTCVCAALEGEPEAIEDLEGWLRYASTAFDPKK